jgi:hypothetical protein
MISEHEPYKRSVQEYPTGITEQRERQLPPRQLLIVGHTYQPPREYLDLSDASESKRVDIAAFVNERIYQECYKPIFYNREQLPEGVVVSFYGSLREWIKAHHPDEFAVMREHINNLPNKEYQILGDPYLHPILPLESEENQDMLIKIGKQAFEQDFGFSPKGVWLPETAVSETTMKVLHNNDYEFVVLRDSQLQSTEQNPMFVPISENGKRIGELAVIHFDSGMSGSVSLGQKDVTARAEDFLHDPNFAWKRDYTIGTDTEFYGHHRPFKDNFLYYVMQPDVLTSNGFGAFNVKDNIDLKEHKETDIWENSSWSCDHNLGRWKGTCGCGEPSDWGIVENINRLYTTINKYGASLDDQLDAMDPSWRSEFAEYFLTNRAAMFAEGKLTQNPDSHKNTLFKAQMARYTAETSCFGFFRDADDRPEREITRSNIDAIKTLVPSVEERTIFQMVAD